jgi:UDP:flavonoid glycosyltransferase YjiC (YdhE family)
MRILVATTAGWGHFRPLTPFADAALAAGHEVVVASPESFRANVESDGYRAAAFGDIPPEEFAAALREAGDGPEERDLLGRRIFGEMAPRAAMPGLRAIIADYRPDLVLRDAAEMASWRLTAEGRIPQVTMFFTTHRMLRSIFARPGAPDISGTTAVSLFPASLDPVDGPPVPHRFRGSTSGATEARGEEPGRPLVYVSYGTVTPGQPAGAERLRQVVSALAELPVDLVVSIGRSDPAAWGELRDRADLRPWVDEAEVLDRAAAAVCHGGAGTTLAALGAGVPLVVVPQFGDQPAIGEAVDESGTGLNLGLGDVAPEDVEKALTRVLSEAAFGERAREVALDIAGLPPASDAVGLFESLI